MEIGPGAGLSDQSAEKIQTTVRLTLMDHLRLQLWGRWIFLPRTLAIFLGAAAIGAITVSIANGGSLGDIVHGLLVNWTLYGFFLAFGLLVTMGFVPLIGTIRWLSRRKRSREITVILDDVGVGYSAGGIDVTIRWENITAYSPTSVSFLIRGGRLLLRLPKRAFSQAQIEAITALFERKSVRAVPAWKFR